MDMAKTAIEGSRNIVKKIFSERFEEKFYQHAVKMLEAAQTPFAKESITLAQAEAKKRYDNEMNSMNVIQKGARKTWDTIKEYTFGSTTLEHYTVDALVQMRDTNPVLLKEQEAYRSEQQAMAKRFEGAFNDSDIDIRKNLGEKLLILDPTKPEHKPMVDGIKSIVKDYYTKKEDGTYMTDAELQDRLDTFYADTIRTNTPEGERIFTDAETYASSLTAVAKEMKGRIEHIGGLEAMDAELGTMEVRLGVGVMGEATELKPTETRRVVAGINKTIDALVRKGILRNVVLNDATVGTAVSAILALKVLPQAALSSTARMWLGAAGGGTVAGVLSGRREYGRRQVELRRVVAQKEAGVVTPDSAKQRQWYESFDFRLRTASELVGGMQTSIYSPDKTLKNNLTEDELRTSLANLADAKARKILSSRENNRFGLIVLGAVGEQETNRTHLDKMVKQTEKDLTTYLDGHQTDAAVTSLTMGATGTECIGRLTAAQTSILQEGNDVLNTMTDPAIKLALSPLSSYTPEVDKLRYSLGIFGKTENRKSKGTGSGLDAVLKDFNTQATAEGARMGLKTAGIGIGVGALVNEAVMDIKYGWGSGALSRLFTHPDVQPALAMASGVHAETIGGHTITLGNNMDIDAQGNLDVMDAAGHIHHDVVTNFASHVQTDATGMHLDKSALDLLHRAGLNPALTSQEVTTQSIQHTTVASSPTELPGALHVADAAGVDHTAMWSIPNGTHLVPGADSHTFALADTQGKVLIADIHTNDNGAITNFEEIQNHLPDGWTIKDIPQQFTTEGAAAIDNTTRTVNVYTDIHEGGMWQWAQEHVAGTPLEHENAALNVIKNVWKSYQNVIAHDANITFDKTIPGYENIARSVPHLPNGDIWPNAIPNNSIIELPNSLFSDHNMAHLAQWSDQAVRMYDAELLANPGWDPMTALAHIQGENPLMGLVLRIGRFGMVSQERLSADELNMLMHALSATDTPANVVTDLHSIVFTETLSNTVPNTTIETVLTAVPQFTGPEGFIPIIPIEARKGLEKTVTPFKIHLPDFHYEEHTTLDQLQTWIKNNPTLLHPYKKELQPDGSILWLDERNQPVRRDVTQEKQSLQLYLDTLKSNNPEYYQYLESLSSTTTMAPMTEQNRVSVNIPAWMEGKIIYHTLQSYIEQKDEQGNLVPADTFEINLIINRKTGAPPDETVTEINRFIQDSKDKGQQYHINYLDVEFNPPLNNVGHARKVINDLTLLRSVKRANQTNVLYLESEDADLEFVDPKTVHNLIHTLDTQPHLDAVVGIQDRNPDVMMQNDYLFLSYRLDEITGRILQQRKSLRPENNPKWHSYWNRIITGGWNTAYTAQAYGMIGGGDSGKNQGEDTVMGEKISMCRGDGRTPNLDVIGRVPTRSDSSPRRFIETIVSGGSAYGDAFVDEELNKKIKTLSLPELMKNIEYVARIEPENYDMFKGRIGWTYEFIQQATPNEAEAKEIFKLAMSLMGLKQEDYHFTSDGKVEIDRLDTIKQALEDYRSRHTTPKQPGERTKYETPKIPSIQSQPQVPPVQP